MRRLDDARNPEWREVEAYCRGEQCPEPPHARGDTDHLPTFVVEEIRNAEARENTMRRPTRSFGVAETNIEGKRGMYAREIELV